MTRTFDRVQIDFNQAIQAESRVWYNAIQRLGSGGNAVTWLVMARGGSFRGTPFAMKIFQNVGKQERKQSFLDERRFLQTIEHPAIMRMFDQGRYRSDHPFVVVEYLPQTLRQIIRSDTASMVERIGFVTQLLSALDCLSKNDPPIIHRDIKPANIFAKASSCILGDFGLLKEENENAENDPESIFKQSVGAGMPFFYRTPDLVRYARGEALPTTASDVFQLGLVVAELFTGKNPERRAENNDFQSDVVLDRIGNIRGSRSEMIATYIRGMLEFDPANRTDCTTLLEQWSNLFFAVAGDQNALEGRVFVS